MDLLIIRHGQSEANSKGLLISDSRDKLTPLGIIQSCKLKKKINQLGVNASLIFCSPWARAFQTAEIVFGEGASIALDGRIAETNPGKFKNWLEVDFNIAYPEFNLDIKNKYEEGESHLEMANRVIHWINEEVETRLNQLGLIVIVSHGGPISVMLQYLLKIPVEKFYPTFAVQNASLTKLKWDTQRNRYILISAGCI
ncbi:histidine phosphatase family protein [Polynucleobacter paneuropaeus]|nr:histidine phosphatase family protein [Polynucleobacter paneuropaeus]